MMKTLQTIIFVFLLVSCGNKNMTNSIVDDTEVDVSTSELAISSIIEVENMVPLETTDSSLVGKIEKLMKRNKQFYVKSANQVLTVFDQNGKYLNSIGRLGTGPEEYPTLLDFDVNAESIYILTAGKILVYSLQGQYSKSIPLSINVSGFRLVEDKILLFVLGDEHVIHLIDMNGDVIEKTLKRSPALRLSKSIPFVWYGNQRLLFSQGRSNNLLVYNTTENKFESINYLSSANCLSVEEENSIRESEGRKSSSLSSKKHFDGLMSTYEQTIFGSIEGEHVTLWVKDVSKDETKAYSISSLKDDVTFTTSDFLIRENTDGGDVFLSYLMPYRLDEGLDENKQSADCSNYRKVKSILDDLNVEEANPIIIEYRFK